ASTVDSSRHPEISMTTTPRTPAFIRALFPACALILAALGGGSAQTIQLPDSLYTPGDTIAWVKRVSGFNEGPVWDAATGHVYFTRQTLGAQQWPIYRIKPGEDTGKIWVANPGKANGLDLDPQGRLIAAQNGRITRY